MVAQFHLRGRRRALLRVGFVLYGVNVACKKRPECNSCCWVNRKKGKKISPRGPTRQPFSRKSSPPIVWTTEHGKYCFFQSAKTPLLWSNLLVLPWHNIGITAWKKLSIHSENNKRGDKGAVLRIMLDKDIWNHQQFTNLCLFSDSEKS